MTTFSELIGEGIGDNKQTEKRPGLASPRLGDARWFSVFKRQRCLASFCSGYFPLSSGLSSGSELSIVRVHKHMSIFRGCMSLKLIQRFEE